MFFRMWPFSCDYGELSLVRNVASAQRKKKPWISLRKLIWLSNGGCVLTSFRGSFVFIKFEIKFLIIKPKTKRKCRLLGLSFHNVARHRVFVYFEAHVLTFEWDMRVWRLRRTKLGLSLVSLSVNYPSISGIWNHKSFR